MTALLTPPIDEATILNVITLVVGRPENVTDTPEVSRCANSVPPSNAVIVYFVAFGAAVHETVALEVDTTSTVTPVTGPGAPAVVDAEIGCVGVPSVNSPEGVMVIE